MCVGGFFVSCVCVCAILTSPLLNLACITRGSLLVSPRDSQSVLALQYKEILIFKKLPPSMGSVFLQGPCAVIAQLEYMFASICVYVCVLFLSMLPFLFHIKVGHVTEKGEDQSQALVTSLATRAVLLCYYNRSTRQSKWKPSEIPFWDSATKLGQISSLALSRSKAGEGIFTAAAGGGQFDLFRPGLPRINVDPVHKFVSEALLSCFCH